MRTKSEIKDSFVNSLAPFSPDGNGLKSETPLHALVTTASDEIHKAYDEIKSVRDLIGGKENLAKMIADDLWKRLQKKNDIEKGEFIDSLRTL